MTSVDMTLARLLLAAFGSLLAGCAIWAVATLCRKCMPALSLQRSPWLLGQLAVAAVFAAMLLPPAERLRMAPVIEMGERMPAHAAAPSAAPAARPAPAAAPAPASASAHAWLRAAAVTWLALYLLGLAHALYRWRRGQRVLDTLAASGAPVTDLAAHAGFAALANASLPAVIEVDAPISPMLQGVFKPRMLLPRHLRSFDPLQQQLIIEHELMHWRRHDLRWSAAALALQCLFWFNPFMRMLRARLAWAQEFACDREVLRVRPQGQRKAYAAALVAQLKLQQSPSSMALAFGAGAGPSLSARIDLIRTPTTARGRWPRIAALTCLAVVVCANLALQPALGSHVGGAPDDHAQLLARAWPGTSAGTAARLDCTLIVDAASGASLLREGSCDRRASAASTFKIAISLMGFDSGVLRDEHTPYLPYQQRYAAWNPSWREGTDPARWLRESVVWYSDQVRSRLGAGAVRAYVEAFEYGNRGLPRTAGVDDTVALSELSPTLKISPSEQIVFLRKLVRRRLPVSAHAYEMTARLLKVGTLANGWEVYGKTGTAHTRLPDGGEEAIGWFVGWANKDGRTLVFARLLEQPVRTDGYSGPLTRDAFLSELARSTL